MKAVEPQETDTSGQHSGPALTNAKNLLARAASALRHLELIAVRNDHEHEKYLDLRYLQRSISPHAMASLAFPQLYFVILCGWIFMWQDLGALLQAHAATLRTTHILHCRITRNISQLRMPSDTSSLVSRSMACSLTIKPSAAGSENSENATRRRKRAG